MFELGLRDEPKQVTNETTISG